MNKKNKIMLVAAIGAVVILIASSVVQCAVVRAGEGASVDENAPAIGQAASEEQVPEYAGNDASDTAEDSTLALLTSHAWQAEGDAGKTIVFRDGSFVESDGTNTIVSAFSILTDSESTGQRLITANIIRDNVDAQASFAIIVDGEEGSYRVSSDGFVNAGTYVQAAANENGLGVTGIDETYADLVDGDLAGLQQALSAYAANHMPAATQATFDGEVYLDTNEGRVSATFHLDDAASSIVYVDYASGAFTVSG